MCLGFFHTVVCDPRWIYMHHIQSGVLGRQTRVSNPLTLKLQAAAMWLQGTGPWSSVEHHCSSTDLSFWTLALTGSLENSMVLFTLSLSLHVKPNYLDYNYPSVVCGDMAQESTGIFPVSAFCRCTPFLKCSFSTMC